MRRVDAIPSQLRRRLHRNCNLKSHQDRELNNDRDHRFLFCSMM